MRNILRDEKKTAFLLYIVLISAIYSQVVFFGKSLIPTLYYPSPLSVAEAEGRKPVNSFSIDLGTPAFYEVPMNKTIGDMYKNGTIPLWNPYQGIGSPLAAQYSTRTFFPYQVLEDISPYWLWDYFMLFRLVIAAFFTYLFLKLIGISGRCAFLGGLFYCLCGSFTWFINLEQYTNVAMMVPVCLFSSERLVRYKKAGHIAEAAVVFALMLLAGQPEIAIYVMLLIAAYYFFRVVCDKPGSLTFLKDTLRFGGSVLLCLGISALLILPFLEFIPNAYQCHPLGGMMGVQDPTNIMAAVALLIPTFFTFASYYRLGPHNGLWDWLGGYTGVLIPFLIILGYFAGNKHRKYFLFFLIFGIVVVLKNFGFPLVGLIGRLPLLDQSWSPRWAGPVWTFSLACAAAIGLEMSSQAARQKRVIFAAALLLLFAIGFLSYKTMLFPRLSFTDADALKSHLPPVFGGLTAGVVVALTALYVFLYRRSTKALVGSVIFLAICELWFCVPKGAHFPWTALKLIPFLSGIAVVCLLSKEKWKAGVLGFCLMALCFTLIDVGSPLGLPERQDLFKEPDYVTFLKKEAGHSRIIAGSGILMPNFSSSFQLYDLRYINSLSPVRLQNYVDNHLLKEPHTWPTDRLWFAGIPDRNRKEKRSIYQEISDSPLYYSYLGAKYVLTGRDITINLPLVYDKDIKIYKNPLAFPRVYVARDIEMAPGFLEAQELMVSGDVDVKETAILEEEPPAWYKAPSADVKSSQAAIEEYRPDKVKIRTGMGSDGILVLTDVDYPGWRVYVDNQEGRIYRVNGLVRGVFLKEGAHDIIFKYQPLSFRIGALISLVSLLICSALIISDRHLFLRNQKS